MAGPISDNTTKPLLADWMKGALASAAASALILLMAGATFAWNTQDKIQAILKAERVEQREWIDDNFVPRETFASYREEQIRAYASIREMVKDATRR